MDNNAGNTTTAPSHRPRNRARRFVVTVAVVTITLVIIQSTLPRLVLLLEGLFVVLVVVALLALRTTLRALRRPIESLTLFDVAILVAVRKLWRALTHRRHADGT